MSDEKDPRPRATRFAMERFAERFADRCFDFVEAHGIESPIEQGFVGWWFALLEEPARNRVRDYLALVPQAEIECGDKTYRADFLLAEEEFDEFSHYRRLAEAQGFIYPKVVIELDGHEFHERTKEQVAYRDARDRRLQMLGYKVFHISGSALWRDPEAAVREVQEYCAAEIINWFYKIQSTSASCQTD